MHNNTDIAGQRFGRLVALRAAEKRDAAGKKRKCWQFRCDCGTKSIVQLDSVTRGVTQSCGCFRRERQAAMNAAIARDIKGKRYGKLLVIERVADPRAGAYWRCKCDCGNECITRGTLLRYGQTESCGCNRRLNGHRVPVVSGERFGKLVATQPSFPGDSQGTAWLCRCDCGTSHIARAKDLRFGTTTSCGCAKVEALARCHRRNKRILRKPEVRLTIPHK